jgi:hypothetical protein
LLTNRIKTYIMFAMSTFVPIFLNTNYNVIAIKTTIVLLTAFTIFSIFLYIAGCLISKDFKFNSDIFEYKSVLKTFGQLFFTFCFLSGFLIIILYVVNKIISKWIWWFEELQKLAPNERLKWVFDSIREINRWLCHEIEIRK